MNIAEILGRPVSDLAEFDEPDRPGCSAVVVPEHAAEPPSEKRGRLWATLAIVAALAVGLAAGVYLTRSTATTDTVFTPPTATAVAVPPNIGGFAELFTEMHLTGLTSTADLARLYTGEAPDTPASGLWINRSAAVSTRSLGRDFWAVTVAVDVLEMADGTYETAGLQYFELTIAGNGGRPVAVSTPSRIPPPATVGLPAGMPLFRGTVPADQETAVAAYLEAHLTGRGEVARYLSPTARIPIFAEAPYSSVTLGSMGSDSVGRVNVQVEAFTRRGGHHTIEYTLELTFENGVWEVSALVPVVESVR